MLKKNSSLPEPIYAEAEEQISDGAPAEDVQVFLDQIAAGFAMSDPTDAQAALPAFNGFPGRQDLDLSRAARVSRPELTVLSDWQTALIRVALGCLPGDIGRLLAVADKAVGEAAVTVGIGPALSGGLIAGVSGGVGIVFNDREFGVYGSVSAAVGFIASLTVNMQLTFVSGGISKFRGDCYVLGANIGVVVFSGGVMLLMTADEARQFFGVTLQVGVGVGFPIEVFYGFERTWAS